MVVCDIVEWHVADCALYLIDFVSLFNQSDPLIIC